MASSLQVQEPLVPPINFAMACPGVYRSGYPTKKNYPFLRALRLRSILYLCPEDYAESNLKFCEENAINVLRFPTEGNKEPFTDISERLMHRIMAAIVDVRNLPVLIHCNKGKHRTGTVVSALRLLQGWSLVSIFDEYKRFAGDKARVSDQTYIELYYPIVRVVPPYIASWLAVSPRVKIVYGERELLDEENAQLGQSLLAPANPHADAAHVATVAAAVAAKTANRHKDVGAAAVQADSAATANGSGTPASATTPLVGPRAGPALAAGGGPGASLTSLPPRQSSSGADTVNPANPSAPSPSSSPPRTRGEADATDAAAPSGPRDDAPARPAGADTVHSSALGDAASGARSGIKYTTAPVSSTAGQSAKKTKE